MGDIIQIESIGFGNWYKMTKVFLEKKSKNIIDMFTPKNISSEDKKAIDDGLKEGLKDLLF